MNALHYQSLLLLVTLPIAVVACGASLDNKPWRTSNVEVEPAIFIKVEQRSTSLDDEAPAISFRDLHLSGSPLKGHKYYEVFELRLEWKGSNVHWKGNSRPLNLRALGNRMNLITLDRVSREDDELILRYYAQEGSELKEIDPSQYPKAIAGQNMGFWNRGFGQRDDVQIARGLNPEDVYFRVSVTAYIWAHLATGQQYFISSKKEDIGKALFEDYIRTNKPIRLTQIVRDEKPQAPVPNLSPTNSSISNKNGR